MYLMAGLGNPGEKFINTRHNIGRETLSLARRKLSWEDFRSDPKLHSLVAVGKIGKEKLVFILPETFMNKSGLALGSATRFFKIKPERTIVIHDDADLLLGSCKLSFGKNSGGHKGVESVKRALGTKNFWRMRVGIQKKKRVAGEDLVLQKFRSDEEALVKKVAKKSLQAIESIAAVGPERAMNEYNA